MRVYLPQFDPNTPPLSHTQVGAASTVVAHAGVVAPLSLSTAWSDSAAERLLWSAFGQLEPEAGVSYDQLRPAYVLGWRTAIENPSLGWDAVQRYLPVQWQAQVPETALPWTKVKDAVHSGWALAWSQAVQAQPAAVREQHAQDVEDLLGPLVRDGLALASDVHVMMDPDMLPFPYQVLERHVRMLQDFAHELQGLTQEAVAERPPQRLGWWLRKRSALLRLQGRVAHWQYRDVMALCEQREQQLLCSYRSASAGAHSQLLRQVLLHQQHDLQRNMEKLCWVRNHWRG